MTKMGTVTIWKRIKSESQSVEWRKLMTIEVVCVVSRIMYVIVKVRL